MRGSLLGGAQRKWIAALCLLCGILIAIQAWSGRFSMNPDGISYLDMADRLLQGDFGILAHPYWSPLYPTLLALTLKLTDATSASEFPAVHLANLLIGLASLASFTFFIGRWSPEKRNGEELKSDSLTDFRLRTGFAYVLFLGATLDLMSIDLVTPDLCVAALAYLAAGLCCRLTDFRGLRTAVLLGLVLGLAYFAKAAMLPLGVLLIVALLLSGALRRPSLVTAIVLAFFVTAAPLIFVLSRNEKHVTISEAGTLNYAKLVQEVSGQPTHPPRLLNHDPIVFGFEAIAGERVGTYPPHYNPALYFKGFHGAFDLKKQVATLRKSIHAVAEIHGTVPLLAGLIALCYIALRRRLAVAGYRVWLIVWALGAFGMYSLVVVELRYVAAFWVLCWFAIYESVAPGILGAGQRAVLGLVSICICLPLLRASIFEARHANGPFDDLIAAQNLKQIGVRSNDKIAIVGNYDRPSRVARLARLQIVAQVPDSRAFDRFRIFQETAAADQFWSMGHEQLWQLKEELRKFGVTAIIAMDGRCPPGGDWHLIRGKADCALLLR